MTRCNPCKNYNSISRVCNEFIPMFKDENDSYHSRFMKCESFVLWEGRKESNIDWK